MAVTGVGRNSAWRRNSYHGTVGRIAATDADREMRPRGLACAVLLAAAAAIDTEVTGFVAPDENGAEAPVSPAAIEAKGGTLVAGVVGETPQEEAARLKVRARRPGPPVM